MARGLLLALLLGATPALAEDVALLIGNENYSDARDIWAADNLPYTDDAFEAAGFRVFRGEDLTAEEMRQLASDFVAAADGSGRMVIALAGHFARSQSEGWFLGTDTDEADLITASAEGLPLSVLYEVAARAPGRSVVLLGTEDRRISLGHGLTAGFPDLDVPQGVAVIQGDADDIADFAEDALLEPGRRLSGAVGDYRGLTAAGFIPNLPFVEEAPRPGPPNQPPSERERTAWAAALAANTVAGYERFLRDYPDSPNAPAARAEIERLGGSSGRRDDPVADAEDAEDALRLSRNARRAIQRQLTLLGFNTRGIDGIFGPATRGAVRSWQRDNRFEETGYLNREQLEVLADQAERRAAQLEAEAAAREAERAQRDQAYWEETGARGTENGLRAYLERYPDGLYAEVAQERLRPFDERRRDEAEREDRRAWDRARDIDTIAAYRSYLDEQPGGAFRERASERIGELERNSSNAQAARVEEQLGLNTITRNLIEARLQSLGLKPGRVDGVFDENTRRAIRRYQSARNLPSTGYLSQDTVVRLLADSILR